MTDTEPAMKASSAGPATSVAFDSFKKAMRGIDVMTRGVDAYVIPELERRAARADEKAARLAEVELAEVPPGESKSKKWVEVKNRIEEHIDIWKRESRRRAAVAYCTVFEAYLRDLLVERCTEDPTPLDVYLQKSINAQRNEIAKRLPLAEARLAKFVKSLRLESLARPLTPDHIDQTIEAIKPSFQNVDGVNQLFVDLLNTELFSWKRKCKFKPNPVFPTEAARAAAYRDIRILFYVRHQLVHRNGTGCAKYRKDMNEERYWDRLCEPLKSKYEPRVVGATPLGQWPVPDPDQVLESDARDLGNGKTKLEEFAFSVKRYARFIDHLCSFRTQRPPAGST